MRLASPTSVWRSRLGRLASSSASVGTTTILQCPRSPRSQPRKPRFKSSMSSRSVFARRCSRGTAGVGLCRLVSAIKWRKPPSSLDLPGLCRIVSPTQADTCRQPVTDTLTIPQHDRALTPIAIANLKARPQRYEGRDAAAPDCASSSFRPRKSFIVALPFSRPAAQADVGPCLVATSRRQPKSRAGHTTILAAARELATKALRQAKGGS